MKVLPARRIAPEAARWGAGMPKAGLDAVERRNRALAHVTTAREFRKRRVLSPSPAGLGFCRFAVFPCTML